MTRRDVERVATLEHIRRLQEEAVGAVFVRARTEAERLRRRRDVLIEQRREVLSRIAEKLRGAIHPALIREHFAYERWLAREIDDADAAWRQQLARVEIERRKYEHAMHQRKKIERLHQRRALAWNHQQRVLSQRFMDEAARLLWLRREHESIEGQEAETREISQ